ncbi:MAG: hypothetical protein IJI14_10495 [Anaerolineaceae bacterium]|nr:hypothetical protein [Anaerolineaceae bacterium]
MQNFRFNGLLKLFIRSGYDPDTDITFEDVKSNWNGLIDAISNTDPMTAQVVVRTEPEKVKDGVLYINAGNPAKKKIVENHAALELSIAMKALTGKNVAICVVC